MGIKGPQFEDGSIPEGKLEAAVQSKLNAPAPTPGAPETRTTSGAISAADNGKVLWVPSGNPQVDLTFDAGLVDGFEITVVVDATQDCTVVPQAGDQIGLLGSDPAFNTAGVFVRSASLSFGGNVLTIGKWKKLGTKWVPLTEDGWGLGVLFSNALAVGFGPGVASPTGAWYHTNGNDLESGSGLLVPTSVTISLWVKSPNSGNSGAGQEPFWLGQWRSGGANFWKLDVYETGGQSYLRFHIIDQTSGNQTIYRTALTNIDPTPGNWIHVLLVWDPANPQPVQIWSNGSGVGVTDDGSTGGGASGMSVVGLDFDVGSMVDNGTNEPVLAAGVPTKQYGGEMDEIAIWFNQNQLLTSAGVISYLTTGAQDLSDIGSVEPGTIAPHHWWRMGDGVVPDLSVGDPVNTGDLVTNLGSYAAPTLDPGSPGGINPPLQQYTSGVPLVV